MTEIKPQNADGVIARPPKDMVAWLIYGPDQGLVRERAEKLIKTVTPNLKDPFLVADLDDGTLVSDPARLFDEAAAISMLGGRRVVRVRGAGNNLAKLFERFLDDPVGDALVVVEGGDLAKSGALPKVFIGADNAACIACYGDSARDLPDVVRDTLRSEGLTIAPDALADAASRLGSDRGVTRRELEKLAMYAHGQKQVTLEDVRAVLGDEAEARTDEALDGAAEGDFRKLDLALERLWISGTSPAQIIRMALTHFQKLALARADVDRGETADGAMRKVRPPVNFMRQSAFKAQLNLWDSPRLLDACDLLLETEALSRTTAVPAETVTARALLNIAAMARAGRR
ncbi:MAG: DNA polymerase III subunit delta [Alphaproteobacteria bacterium]|nr:DNA polymerase III subunit delta [Alphaproteobacteria bacterium]